MKQYTKPKLTCDSIEESSFVLPLIGGLVVGAVATKIISKGLDALFERLVPFNANNLEPVLAY